MVGLQGNKHESSKSSAGQHLVTLGIFHDCSSIIWLAYILQNINLICRNSTKDLASPIHLFAFFYVLFQETFFLMNNIFIILFHCSRPFQRYQIWYICSYLNLTYSQARPSEGVVLEALHRLTSRYVPNLGQKWNDQALTTKLSIEFLRN